MELHRHAALSRTLSRTLTRRHAHTHAHTLTIQRPDLPATCYAGYKAYAEHINEFSIVAADSTTGRLLANSRGHPYRWNRWSDDDGSTWSKPEESTLKDSVNQHNHGCEASMTNIRNKLFFFNPTGQGHDARTKMAVRCSLDGGKTWPKSYHVTKTDDGGYSDLIQVENRDNNILLLAWGYADDKTGNRNMHVEHIDIKWCEE